VVSYLPGMSPDRQTINLTQQNPVLFYRMKSPKKNNKLSINYRVIDYSSNIKKTGNDERIFFFQPIVIRNIIFDYIREEYSKDRGIYNRNY
jgi:hypothetical protein